MKIFKTQLALLAVLLWVWACGIKSPPIPKDSLNIPFPINVGLTLDEKGVIVANNEDNYTVLVEKAINEDTLFSNRMFKRVSMIKPDSTYLDEDVQEGLTYTYRFKNYDSHYNTFSGATTKTIKYSAPVTLGETNISQYENTVCISTALNTVTDYAVVNINGRNIGKIEKDGSACFDLPETLVVNIMVLPYDFNGNSGVPYKTTINRNAELVLLPPQNIRALRNNNSVVLTWDKAANVDSYNIYIKEKSGLKLVGSTDITLYQHSIGKNQKCIDFEMSSVRGTQESGKVKITSCP